MFLFAHSRLSMAGREYPTRLLFCKSSPNTDYVPETGVSSATMKCKESVPENGSRLDSNKEYCKLDRYTLQTAFDTWGMLSAVLVRRAGETWLQFANGSVILTF